MKKTEMKLKKEFDHYTYLYPYFYQTIVLASIVWSVTAYLNTFYSARIGKLAALLCISSIFFIRWVNENIVEESSVRNFSLMKIMLVKVGVFLMSIFVGGGIAFPVIVLINWTHAP